jgi:hypothetical protein
LLRVGAAGGVHAPAGALAVADGAVSCQVAVRVSRLLRPAPRLRVPALVLVGLLAAVTVAIPAACLTMPL